MFSFGHVKPVASRSHCRISLAAIVLSMGVSSGAASEFKCANVDAAVSHIAEPGTDLICEGAADAIQFLGSIGVQQKSRVEVNVVDLLPAGLQNAVGCYDWVNDDVFLLGTSACLEGEGVPQAFKVPNDPEIYKSYVAHEVAHAIATQNFAFDTPSRAAHEYIAGVVQLSVLGVEKRSGILNQFSGDGFDKDVEINFLVYEINPARFAVEAYRHFVKIEDGPDFIRKLLQGEVRLRDQSY